MGASGKAWLAIQEAGQVDVLGLVLGRCLTMSRAELDAAIEGLSAKAVKALSEAIQARFGKLEDQTGETEASESLRIDEGDQVGPIAPRESGPLRNEIENVAGCIGRSVDNQNQAEGSAAEREDER